MLKDLVIANRSYRGYDETYKLTREELLNLVDHARLAPSSINAQPLRYFLAWKPEEVGTIQSLTKWARQLPKMHLPHEGMCPTGFIVICQDTTVSESLSRFQKDVGIVAQTILLAAVEQGLGGCMIGNFTPKSVSTALQLDEKMMPMLIVAIGKPKEQIVLKELEEGGSTKYYRDENDVHYVPKHKLEDLIIS